MLETIDVEIAATLKRIDRVIDRKIHFAARSAGQKRRWQRMTQAEIIEWRSRGLASLDRYLEAEAARDRLYAAMGGVVEGGTWPSP